jgi:threonine dehydratase
MLLIWERMKIIIEPSCAVTLAVVLKNKEKFKNKNIALILTGGNVEVNDTY